MAEYIEREKVIAKCKEIASCEWNHRASPVSWADAYEQFADDVEDIPAADVAPVVHGRWVMKETMIRSPFAKNAYCSECCEETVCAYNFCPNCGAKMDGGKHETD